MRFVLSQQSRNDLAAQFQRGGLFQHTLTSDQGVNLQIDLWLSEPVGFSRTVTVDIDNTTCRQQVCAVELALAGKDITDTLATLIETATNLYGLDEILDDERIPQVLARLVDSQCECSHCLTTEDDLTLSMKLEPKPGRLGDVTLIIGAASLTIRLMEDRQRALADLSRSLQMFLQGYRQHFAA